MSNQVIFLGPSLDRLDNNKLSRARPIRHSSARPFSPYTDSSTGRSSRKRPRLQEKSTLVDETQLDLSPLTKTTTPQQSRATFSKVKSITSSDSARSDSRRKENAVQHDKQGHQDIPNENVLPPIRASDEDVINKEPISAIPSLLKQDKLRLGPARVVGMRRTNVGKPPLLKALEQRPVPTASDKSKAESLIRPGPRPLSDAGNRSRMSQEDSLGGFTTIESIPPPPTHAFSLSSITSISTLLSSPNCFLSSYQGGSQHEAACKFNLLALVVRVSGLEDAPDWKAEAGRRMDRCELVVKDGSDCSIKVILEKDCATVWASPKEYSSVDSDLYNINSLAGDSQLSETYSDRYASSLEALDDSTSASRSTIERQKNNRLFPLCPGDVISLSRLILSRPRSCKQQGRPSSFAHAIASPIYACQVEICWRSRVQSEEDKRRNFDKSLTTFDARCKAIYRLAQMWSPSMSP